MSNLKWMIGEVEIEQIVELQDAGKLIQSTMKEATQENIKKIPWLYPHFANEQGNFKSLVQNFLVRSQGKNILVDACNGNGKTRSDLQEWGNLQTNYLDNFRKTGLTEEDINIVVCTHLHCDHVGWNTKLVDGRWVPTFPNAKYLFVNKEFNYWKQKPEKEMKADKEAFDDSVEPVVKAGLSKLVEVDSAVDENIRLRPTFGHSPGHVSIVISSKGEQALISGDFIHHPCQFVHPEWTMDANVLPDVSIETRKQILEELANSDNLLIGSHFADPVAGYVIKTQRGYEFKV